jgi:hypothetical protein
VSTDLRSVIAFEHYREGAQRFEYFVLGLSTALCAYAGQTLKPQHLGFSSYTLEVVALTLLVASVIVGFKRAELISLGALINHEILHLREQRGTFVKGLAERWTPEFLRPEIEKMTKGIELREKQAEEIRAGTVTAYKWRNWLLGIGFVGLFVARVLAGYG